MQELMQSEFFSFEIYYSNPYFCREKRAEMRELKKKKAQKKKDRLQVWICNKVEPLKKETLEQPFYPL